MPGTDVRRMALDYHEADPPGKIAIAATKPVANQGDLALAYSPGVAHACEEIARDPAAVSRIDGARQPRRRHHQRHRRARPRQYRPARLQAGDGRQGRPVQEVRRHRRLRHRGRRDGVGAVRRGGGAPRADVRRHQPRGHQGAGVLRDRAPPQGAHAAFRCSTTISTARRSSSRPAFSTASRSSANRSSEVKLVCSGAGAAALACLNLLCVLGLKRENIWIADIKGVVYEGRTALMDPLQGDLRAGNVQAHAGRDHARRRCLSRAFGGADRLEGDGGAAWRHGR